LRKERDSMFATRGLRPVIFELLPSGAQKMTIRTAIDFEVASGKP
jgi:hypothetical protein